MRPLKLELAGFTAFTNKISLDLSDLDLFAITGPTGAGKSSLIDAIAYALYGRIPRVANQVGSCISQALGDHGRMYVRFEFRARQEAYGVYRETRHIGPGQVRLDRAVDGQWVPLANREADVKQRIEKILGLDFDGFTRAVLLPQGEFDEFLKGSPDKRREVLRGLLRLEIYQCVQVRASSLAAGLSTRISGIQGLLDGIFRDATPGNLSRLRDELETFEEESGALAEQIDALQRAADLAKELTSARDRLKATRAELKKAQIELAAVQQLVREGDARIDGANGELQEIQGKIAANPFDPNRFAALTGAETTAANLAQAVKALEQATAEVVRLEEAATQTRIAAVGASQVREEAQRAREAAEEVLRHAQKHYAAAFVQEDLAPGDSCPVCGAVINKLPDIERADLESARAAVERARQQEQAAQQAASRAASEAAAAQARVEAGQRQCGGFAERRAVLESDLVRTLPDDQNRSLASIRAALEKQREAQHELHGLSTEEKKAKDEVGRLQQELGEAKRNLERLRERVTTGERAAAAGQTEELRVARDLAQLVDQQGWADIGEKLAAEDVTGVLGEQLRAARDSQAELQTRIGKLRQQIEQLLGQIEKRGELEKELQTLKAEHDVAADLAQMLRADRFQAFVQGEALQLLAEEGSRKLHRLSGGRYRLCVAANSRDFEVVDQYSFDEARSVRTLSGGETFLASLALSLALAETLPGLAASQDMTLDSIFLDEGFGSLDSEALDRAADALDSLRTENRMVCVVTHLEELAERLPARVVVHASESGSTLKVTYT